MAPKIVTPPVGRHKVYSPASRNEVGMPSRQTCRPEVVGTPRSPSKHIDGDQYVRLLACVGREGGIATIDDISRCLSAVARPISAILDLCDAGILAVDIGAAFDGDMRVRRLDD